MGRRKKKTTILVTEKVYIKKADLSGFWHYYFSLDGKQFRKSAKTEDEAKAKQLALNAYHEALERKHFGTTLEKVSFKRLARRYLESLIGQPKYNFHYTAMHRNFIPFFGSYDDITKITAGALSDYLIWRRQKSDNKILPQSLNKENVAFNQMMRLAQEHEWIKQPLKIKRQSEAQTQNRRPHFTQTEYEHLVATSLKRTQEFVSGALSAKQRGYFTARHWNRLLLHDIILILANSGMRVDEVKTIIWRNINWEESTVTLNRAGKVKSSRVLLIRDIGMEALARIKSRRLDYLKAKGLGELDLNERIQSLPNGTFTYSLRKGFNELLKECGFQYKTVKDKHSLTSLRHTYATLRLTAQTGKRVSIRGLVKQMGTSQKMIEKNYGHDVVEDYRDELLG